jgi:WD40 repeat protein
LDTGVEVRVFEGHEQTANSVTMLPDGRRAISGSRDGTVRVWELETGRMLSRLGGHTGERVLTVAADGRVALTVDDGGILRVWDLETEGMTHSFEAGRELWFSAATVTPDDAQAVLGCWGGGVMLFDLVSGNTLRAFEGHSADVNVIEASRDGTFVISGSDDKTAVMWHLPTGRKLGVLEGHMGMVTALAITQDGRRAVTGRRTPRSACGNYHLAKTRQLTRAPTDRRLPPAEAHSLHGKSGPPSRTSGPGAAGPALGSRASATII